MRVVLLGALVGLVAGCGYQLRGGFEIPESLSPVEVRGGSDDLRQRLTLFLTGGGARIAADADKAESILAVQDERLDERVLSVDSETGKAREFEVTYRVSFEMMRPDGSVLLPRRELNLVRNYVFDPNAVIGKSRERGVLEEEMRRDAAEQIVRTLARLFHQPTAADADLPASTALRSAKVLDVLSSTPARLVSFVCGGISAPSLRALVRNAGWAPR
ncbi:MAG: hypothetical protein GWO05_10940 [Gammaproteobacteria bacterium]|nr:hypothetical protein [Gammaproteobacteria bacterium]